MQPWTLPRKAFSHAHQRSHVHACRGSMAVYATIVWLVLLKFSAAWTQQYGDAFSSNYVDYQGPAYIGWNYTTDPFVSQSSPSVSRMNGVMFYPLRAYVIALAPNGTVLWKTGVAPNGEAYLTNTVYSELHDLVVVGASWVQQKTFFQVVAVRGSNGSIAWTSVQNNLFHATTISISTVADAVYVAGFDHSTFSGLRLADGMLLWRKPFIPDVGIFMQTKVGPVPSNSMTEDRKSKEMVLLPTDPWDGFEGKGNLLSYETSKLGFRYWHSDLGFTAGGLFAFSTQGMIFGRDGGGGGALGQQMFGIHSLNGSIVFNGAGYCASVSGPAVDSEGYVYYSCGNQVYSIFPNGSLRWLSKAIGNSTFASINSPSVHPAGYIYFIHNDDTKVVALSAKDGSMYKVYSLTAEERLGFLEPPILLGNEMMYLLGFKGRAIAIFTVKL